MPTNDCTTFFTVPFAPASDYFYDKRRVVVPTLENRSGRLRNDFLTALEAAHHRTP
jgi:hypothetical protein